LLHSSENLGAMLLERLSPGMVLRKIQEQDDEKATFIAANLLKNFPRILRTDASLPTVSKWAETFCRVKEKKKNNPMPLENIERAQALFKDLEQSKAVDAILHGDFHHDNVLFDQDRGWLMIDPKGVIGDPGFDSARFLNNPNPTLLDCANPKSVIESRLEILSSVLNQDRERLLAWAYVDCIISACWWIESGGRTCNFSLQCAEIFDSLLKRH